VYDLGSLAGDEDSFGVMAVVDDDDSTVTVESVAPCSLSLDLQPNNREEAAITLRMIIFFHDIDLWRNR
jgi:hypothetical protein